jgi:hypothetical protein
MLLKTKLSIIIVILLLFILHQNLLMDLQDNKQILITFFILFLIYNS